MSSPLERVYTELYLRRHMALGDRFDIDMTVRSGAALPEGVLRGRTLVDWIGHWGMYIGALMMKAGIVLTVSGWRVIHRRYWRMVQGDGELVQSGVYRYSASRGEDNGKKAQSP